MNEKVAAFLRLTVKIFTDADSVTPFHLDESSKMKKRVRDLDLVAEGILSANGTLRIPIHK